MRDALVAAINLNIFNKHCDRVKMACIAQLVNVLQSVILTEGAKMLPYTKENCEILEAPGKPPRNEVEP